MADLELAAVFSRLDADQRAVIEWAIGEIMALPDCRTADDVLDIVNEALGMAEELVEGRR